MKRHAQWSAMKIHILITLVQQDASLPLRYLSLLAKLDSVHGLILQFKQKMGLFDNFPWFDSENNVS